MKKLVKIVITLIIVFLVILIINTKNTDNLDGETFKIGVVGVLSGPAAFFGEDGLHGAQIAVDEINSKGGINGTNLELVSEDYAYDPKQALPAYNYLKQQGLDHYIIQGSTAASILAPEIIKDGNISFMSVETTPDYADGNPNTCRIGITSDKFGTAIVESIYEENPEANIAILMNINEAGESFREAVVSKSQELGIQIVADEGFEVSSGDFRTQITKIKEVSDDNTYLVVNNVTNTIEPMFKQIGEMGIESQIYADMFTVTNGNLKDKSLIKGVSYINYAFNVEKGEAREFAEKFETQYGAQPGLNAATSYDLIYVMAKALDKGGATPNEISDYLIRKGNGIEGITGEISFNSDCEVNREFVVDVYSN